ncbi:MAG: sulfotransferase [Gammaproteobacteria bacterium]|nr:MAG: sulfotransferase [Gammaproteobacteria bacterium]
MIGRGIALGGAPSSGTTLLRAILDSHSTISCGPEVGIFDRFFIYRRPFSHFRSLIQITGILSKEKFFVKGNSKRKLNLIHEVLSASSLFPSATNFSPGPTNLMKYYVDDWNAIVSLSKQCESYNDFFCELFGCYAESKGSSAWVEKTPENIYCANSFLKKFKEFKFIHVVRNPLDVVASMINRSFHPFSIEDACARVIEAIRQHNRCCQNKRYLCVWYEEMVIHPDITIRKIMEFLGLDFEMGQLEFYKNKRDATSGYAQGPIHSRSIGRWRKDLDRESIEKIYFIFQREKIVFYGDIPTLVENEVKDILVI